jgi:replicative DNA helicase
VVALSQLSRAVETRGESMPKLSDLRESGALEQDADLIMFLYRKENPPEAESGTTDLSIGKHRNGPTGSLKLVFKSEYTRFEDLSPRQF